MSAQQDSSVGMWLRRGAVLLLTSALLMTGSFAFADSTPDPAPSPAESVSSPSTPAPAAKASISVASRAYLRQATYATGNLVGFSGEVSVALQVSVSGSWRTISSTKTTGTGYKLRMSYNEASTGSLNWRVQASSTTNGTVVSPQATQTRVANPVVTTSAAKTAIVGSDLRLTGKLSGFLPGNVSVESQVKVNGAWKTVSKINTSGTSYSVKANFKAATLGTYEFRAVARQSVVNIPSSVVKVVRVPARAVSINKNSVKLLSASASATGTVKGYDGRVKVLAQALVGKSWVTKSEATITVRYNGTKYSLPLNYGKDSTGGVVWRVQVVQGSARSTSPNMRITRTLKGIDKRCLTGRVLCISKKDRKLRWMVDGKVVTTLDARFGASATPTREGTFRVFRKSRNHVSSLYGSSMPFAMFFSGGQAVHYSRDFAARGYAGASHGCVNIRNYAAIKALFDKVKVGDKVVVYK